MLTYHHVLKTLIVQQGGHGQGLSKLLEGIIQGEYLPHRIQEKLLLTFLILHFVVEKQKVLAEILSQDPRPAYDTDETRVYGVEFAGFDVRFTVSGEVLKVKELVKLI